MNVILKCAWQTHVKICFDKNKKIFIHISPIKDLNQNQKDTKMYYYLLT